MVAASLTDDVIRLATLVLRFGRVNRSTFHPDGVTPESDTDHTVMLALIACAFAERHAPNCDVGRVAQFALVHDLVEVYAGDTPTLALMTDADRQGKKDREAAALARIEAEFGAAFPWLVDTMHQYESLATPEARLVKAMDKAMPKITHLLNGGVDVRLGKGERTLLQDIRAVYEPQRAQMARWAGEWPELQEAWSVLVHRMYALAGEASATEGLLPGGAPTDAMCALGEVALRFGRIDRVTCHEDGATPESDTDHTVMLSVVGCALASYVAPNLDPGQVAQFALVHDLVEVYAGDVNTFGPSADIARQGKAEREHAALERLAHEFGATFPWVPARIAQYESRATPEARFVWAIDKLLPAVVNVTNGGSSIRACVPGTRTADDVRRLYAPVRARLAPACEEWPAILALWDVALERVCPHFHSQPA
jgi:5'-deoxynucleotidase YfbR-like HD superfamily hydrolase